MVPRIGIISFTIYIPRPLNMQDTEFCQYNPCNFREEADNNQMLTHNDGQKQIAIGYLRDSVNLIA